MKTTVNGRSVTITEDQKLLFDKKMARFDRIFGDDAESTAVLRKAGRNITVEVTISSGGMLYRSEVEDEAWQTALDRCIEHIERQIRKNKTRLEKRLREGALEKEARPDFVPVEDEEDEEFKIVRSKRFPIKPMSPEEAILQMNLLEHEFFVFRNEQEDGAISVVYRRKNGGYGLISDDAE